MATISKILLNSKKVHLVLQRHMILVILAFILFSLFSSVVTASIASFILGLVMVLVILVSRRFNVNPDNVATPIAASLGDYHDAD